MLFIRLSKQVLYATWTFAFCMFLPTVRPLRSAGWPARQISGSQGGLAYGWAQDNFLVCGPPLPASSSPHKARIAFRPPPSRASVAVSQASSALFDTSTPYRTRLPLSRSLLASCCNVTPTFLTRFKHAAQPNTIPPIHPLKRFDR